MSISRISKRVESLGSAWEEFKHVNDRRLSEIEKKGSADAVTVDHLNRINHALDGYKSRLDTVETAMSRPATGMEYAAGNPEKTEHRSAFCKYLRKGIDSDLNFLEKKALSVGTDADGGYLVTPYMSETIAKVVFDSSPMRQLASVQTISTDSMEVIQDTEEAAANWTTETGSVSDTTTPQIAQKVINTFELYAQPKATQKLIDDSSVDIEQWLTEKITSMFSRKENTAFISGNGTSQPKGILSYTAGTSNDEIEQIVSGSAGAVTSDSLVQLFYALKEDYATNATFLMNRSVVQAVRLLKESTTDQYMWQPGLAAGAPDTLMGVPVMQAADMPAAATDSLSVAVGDFRRAYQIVDRIGTRILRDPFTEKPFVKFYATKRVGGEVVVSDAIKLLKLSAS